MWKSGLRRAPILAMLIIASPALAQIPNPIGAKSFLDLINALAKAIIQIGAVFAVVAIIIVGFKFLTASISGDTKGLTDAKKMLWWVLIGTAIVVGSSVLAQVIVNTVKTLGSP
ncbi:MAG: TrbC/VirB2 family protein [Candidatus Sungbacteria bacterium]|nr:TrbC/VirB2 family protein [Candidatus Sungbacteria bacterium]